MLRYSYLISLSLHLQLEISNLRSHLSKLATPGNGFHSNTELHIMIEWRRFKK